MLCSGCPSLYSTSRRTPPGHASEAPYSMILLRSGHFSSPLPTTRTKLKLKLKSSLDALARHSLPSHPTAIVTRLPLDPGAGPRRCAIGEDVMQKVYTLMQDLMFRLIIPLVVLRELSSFCLAAPHPSSRSRPSIALVSSICGTIAIQPHPPPAQCIHDDRYSRSRPRPTPPFRHRGRLRLRPIHLYVIRLRNSDLNPASYHHSSFEPMRFSPSAAAWIAARLVIFILSTSPHSFALSSPPSRSPSLR